MWRGGEVESVEKEWKMFRVMECTNDVCGMRRVGGQRRKGSEWWNEEVGWAVAEKRRALRNGFREEMGLRMTVQVSKIMADRRWGERLENDFEGNKKMF